MCLVFFFVTFFLFLFVWFTFSLNTQDVALQLRREAATWLCFYFISLFSFFLCALALSIRYNQSI